MSRETKAESNARIAERNERIAAAHREGGSTRGELAARFGVEASTVGRAIRGPLAAAVHGERRGEAAGRDARILELRAKGASQAWLAAWFGISQPQVSRILISAGLGASEDRGAKYRAAEGEILAASARGETNAAIAGRLGLRHETVGRLLTRNGRGKKSGRPLGQGVAELIKRDGREGLMTQREIAARHGVALSTVSGIICGRRRRAGAPGRAG